MEENLCSPQRGMVDLTSNQIINFCEKYNDYNCEEASKIDGFAMLGKLSSQSKVSPQVNVLVETSSSTAVLDRSTINDGSGSTQAQEHGSGRQMQIYNPVRTPEPGNMVSVIHY